ncbi:DUF3343 domain-containing protein [Hominisplanchenecus sp.]|uniref:DUF3343 domain-containing protein n=1 Tax=Hominisplanchenecus sp. TaxID=3038130 RepID=UPI0039950827
MRKKTKQLVITFSTTTAAMAMEKRAQEMGIFGRLISLPSEISAGCGLSWKTKPEEKEKILVFLEEEKLKWEAMYELELY